MGDRKSEYRNSQLGRVSIQIKLLVARMSEHSSLVHDTSAISIYSKEQSLYSDADMFQDFFASPNIGSVSTSQRDDVLSQSGEDQIMQVLDQLEPVSEFVNTTGSQSTRNGDSLEDPETEEKDEKRCDNYIFKQISTMLKEAVRKFKLNEFLRKDAICRTDFVLRVLCRVETQQEYADVMELFLARLKKEQGEAELEANKFGKACELKNIKWLEIIAVHRNAVKEFEKGDWRRALEIFYRKDHGLKRPQDLANALKKMAALRKELKLPVY